MRKMLLLVAMLLTTVSFGSLYTIEDADEIFAQRGNDVETVHRARSMYSQFIGIESLERVHVVEKLAKLAYFEGALLLPQTKETAKNRLEIFSKCLSDLEHINSENIRIITGDANNSDLEVYRYWIAVCGFNKYKATGIINTVILEAIKYILDHAKMFEAFEDGASHRFAAQIYLDSLGKLEYRKPRKAIKHLEYSQKIFENHPLATILFAEANKRNGQAAAALRILDNGVSKFDLQQYPEDLKPEMEQYRKIMVSLINAVI